MMVSRIHRLTEIALEDSGKKGGLPGRGGELRGREFFSDLRRAKKEIFLWEKRGRFVFVEKEKNL